MEKGRAQKPHGRVHYQIISEKKDRALKRIYDVKPFCDPILETCSTLSRKGFYSLFFSQAKQEMRIKNESNI